MEFALNESNDSAQSPAWSRNASPLATRPRSAWRARLSPANTKGGKPPSVLRAESSSASSGQSGCWPAGRERHESGVQVTARVFQ